MDATVLGDDVALSKLRVPIGFGAAATFNAIYQWP